jgi:hypothetical protein
MAWKSRPRKEPHFLVLPTTIIFIFPPFATTKPWNLPGYAGYAL